MKYTKAEAKLILFDNSDVITDSIMDCGNQAYKNSEFDSGCGWGHYQKDHKDEL